MRSKILKQILSGLLILLLTGIFLMLTPRIWSGLNPQKPPTGYHFEPAVYLALWTGLEKMVSLTPEIPPDVEEFKDIEYKNINGNSLRLDIYKPKNIITPAPLLVFIHGGSWKGGKRSDYLVYLVDFAKRGFITATVSYRLLKDGPYPACAEDISDAVSWLLNNGSNYGYDPERIALIGGSAGAHLAMLAAYGWGKIPGGEDTANVSGSSQRIKALVNIYGPADLTTEYARNHPLVTALIAHSYDESPELYMEASPLFHVDKGDPPTLILHGTSDKLVPVSQSDDLKSRLDSLGVPCVYYRLPLWPHTMDVVRRVNDFCQEKMNEFFEQYLK
ncbi:MAG: alpha/beta hydrolase [Bacteroidales bacterium]|nr:alpha/beta hydrolase [Bacteroidales bacterium]